MPYTCAKCGTDHGENPYCPMCSPESHAVYAREHNDAKQAAAFREIARLVTVDTDMEADYEAYVVESVRELVEREGNPPEVDVWKVWRMELFPPRRRSRILRTSESPDWPESTDVGALAGAYAMLLGELWEEVAEIDQARCHPDKPKLAEAIRCCWRSEGDRGLACPACGHPDPWIDEPCPRCGLASWKERGGDGG